MALSEHQLWVELIGGVIIARIRGAATEQLIRECQARVVALQKDTGCSRVLYDALELDRPQLEIVLTQQSLSTALRETSVKIAIVVPNTSIAYLSRLAFGETDHRVFYNDIAGAVRWLGEPP